MTPDDTADTTTTILVYDANITDPCQMAYNCTGVAPPTLPETGGASAGMGIAGALLVIVGAAACWLARRRTGAPE